MFLPNNSLESPNGNFLKPMKPGVPDSPETIEIGLGSASIRNLLGRRFRPIEVSMTAPLFLLASQSPRRRKLLEALGIPFAVVENPWDEVPVPTERPFKQVRRLAREKLIHYWENHPESSLPILTADTLLSFRGRSLNKPTNEAEAWSFYRQLAGRSHSVLTSFALGDPGTRKIRQKTVSTRVEFVAWDEVLYRRYLDRGEWQDAAGGYKIQETGSILVRRLSGSWSNVVGLPIPEVYGMISSTLRVPRV